MSERRVFFETYGCEMNKAESQALFMELAADGWREGTSAEEADLIVINTCSVRETAEERIRGRLGHYRRLKKRRPFVLALTGCMAERLQERISQDFPEVDVVAGTFHKHEIPAAVRRAEAQQRVVLAGGEEYEFAKLHSGGGFKAFVPVMHGCNNFCAYCVVPYVRGREISRSPEEILEEVRTLDARGVTEVTLLGQNVNSYRFVKNGEALDFPGLMRRVAKQLEGVRWVRFLTSHPKDLSGELIQTLAEHPAFCRHIHLPVQSGSTRVLAAMNRGYSADSYLRLVERIRSSLTGASLSTDILVGFPGETEDDVEQTLRLMEQVGFDDAFMYYYNPRPGTPADALSNQVPREVKLDRLSRVIAAQRRIASRAMIQRLGQDVEVLVEDVSKRDARELLARTEWNRMVVFPGPTSLVGSMARVRLDSARGNTFRGSAL